MRRLPDGCQERPYELFDLVPQGRLIGAEIRGVDLARPLAPALREELNRALLEWKVLFSRRGLHHLPGQQRDFARNWGELETNPLLARGSARTTWSASTRAAAPPPPTRTSGTRTSPSANAPPSARCSSSCAVPPHGGDTMWADMAAAYDNLPEAVKERIEGARAVHDFIPGFARFYGPDELRPAPGPVPARHPRR
ncbi:Alpha-ketoglutarate-dependent taurine dioxygenase [Streptomyces alboniger]